MPDEDTQPSDEPGSADRSDRRAFLKKAGLVGAGVAGATWAAPSMLQLEQAFAVGTCPGGTLSFPWTQGVTQALLTGGGGAGQLVGTTATGGIDVRIISTSSTGVGNGGLVWNNWRVRNATTGTLSCGGNPDFPMGNTQSFYSLEMNANNTQTDAGCETDGAVGRSETVTFGFFDHGTTTPHAVKSLVFTLLDVDTGGGEYKDQVSVQVNGLSGVATVGGAGTFLSGAPFLVLGSAVSQPNTGVATFVGTASSADNSANGNVKLTSNASTPITQVTITFTDVLMTTGARPRPTAPTTIQWIGIGDLTSFCKV